MFVLRFSFDHGDRSGCSAARPAEPLLLIDGVPYNGDDGIASVLDQLTPSNILRIDVFKFGSTSAFGARGANGVIAVYTRNGATLKDRLRAMTKPYTNR